MFVSSIFTIFINIFSLFRPFLFCSSIPANIIQFHIVLFICIHLVHLVHFIYFHHPHHRYLILIIIQQSIPQAISLERAELY